MLFKGFLINSFVIGSIYLVLFSLFCDAAVNYQLSIQDPATGTLEWMVNFYDLLMADIILILAVIFFLILTLLTDSIHHKNSNSYFSHSQNLELFWTIAPALVLLGIAYPSFNLLYSLDDLTDPILTVKIIGHQWYWSYEFLDLDFKSRSFDAYMVPTEDLFLGEFRLLTTDNNLILPQSVPIKLLITSADVLHSWAVPSFGLKVDACPGRLNEASLYVKRTGLYFGQCSEICGVNHGFMPIVVKVISINNWVGELADAESVAKPMPMVKRRFDPGFMTDTARLIERARLAEAEAIFQQAMAATEKEPEPKSVPRFACVFGPRGICMYPLVPTPEEQPVPVEVIKPEPINPALDSKHQEKYSRFLEKFLAQELIEERAKYSDAGKPIPELPELLANAKGAGPYILPSKRTPPVEVVEYGDIRNSSSRPASPDQKADFHPEPQISIARGKVDPTLAFSLMQANTGSGLSFPTPSSSSPELTPEQLELKAAIRREKEVLKVEKLRRENPYIDKFYKQLGPHTYENLEKIVPRPTVSAGSISTTSTSDSDVE